MHGPLGPTLEPRLPEFRGSEYFYFYQIFLRRSNRRVIVLYTVPKKIRKKTPGGLPLANFGVGFGVKICVRNRCGSNGPPDASFRLKKLTPKPNPKF